MLTRREFLQNSLTAGAVAAAIWSEETLPRVAAAVEKSGDRPAEQLAADEDFWFEIQQAFAIDRSIVNLNNGGVSPAPRAVMDALKRHLDFANQIPSRNLWTVMDPQVVHVRSKLARIFGCGDDEIAITRNASESLENCLFGIDLKPGDEVVTTELDYPRMITTLRQREAREGIVLKLLPVKVPVQDLQEIVAAYRAAITPKTRMLLVSHVVFMTGQIFPVRDIVRLGREHNLPVIVDGAHAFAHLATSRDELECDFYGVSLHKWLHAPIGTGLLYMRKERVPTVWPLMAATKEQANDIRKFEEIGTHPAANFLAIAEAAALYEAIGPQRKEARLRYLRDRWAKRLMQDPRVSLATRLEPQHSGGISTVSIKDIEPEKLQSYLWEKHKIWTVAIKHDAVHGLRVTPSIYTTVQEVDQFCGVVEQALANGVPA